MKRKIKKGRIKGLAALLLCIILCMGTGMNVLAATYKDSVLQKGDTLYEGDIINISQTALTVYKYDMSAENSLFNGFDISDIRYYSVVAPAPGYANWKVKSTVYTESGGWYQIILENGDTAPAPVPVSSSENHTSPCSHTYEWVTLTTPTEDASGEEVYRCTKCGDISEKRELSAFSYQEEKFNGFIQNVKANDTLTYDCKRWTCFYDYEIKKMAERPDVTYVLKFEYKNKKYELTIPAGTDYSGILNDTAVCDGLFGVAKKLGLTVVEK